MKGVCGRFLKQMEGAEVQEDEVTALHSKRQSVEIKLERQRLRERVRVLSPVLQACVTNPQGTGGRSLQNQSAAPQQECSTHRSQECVTSYCICFNAYVMRVRVCVCVSVREREGERERFIGSEMTEYLRRQ